MRYILIQCQCCARTYMYKADPLKIFPGRVVSARMNRRVEFFSLLVTSHHRLTNWSASRKTPSLIIIVTRTRKINQIKPNN
jgi:hypothetical protein